MPKFHGLNRPNAEAPAQYHPTPPALTRVLLDRERFRNTILEPCAGQGHVVRVLQEYGYSVLTNELYPQLDHHTPDSALDWLTAKDPTWAECWGLVSNPPYRQALQFIQRAIDLKIKKHAWLLRLQFAEGEKRHRLLFSKTPPSRVHVFSERVQVSEQGVEQPRGGMIVYAWWVWDATFYGRYDGRNQLCWIEPGAVERAHEQDTR